MSLRVVYLIYHAIKKGTGRDVVPNQYLEHLINYLMSAIYKMRNILESKDSFFYDIPKPQTKKGGT